jgi:peptidoglycan/xylan/chitin deacetylase (PgdA/CDA1 family)
VNEVLILCYHAVSPTWAAPLSVTPDEFERQMSFLRRRGWHATTFREAVLRSPQRRTVAVTFDDAFRSVRDLAHPILSALGWPATVFAPTAFMSRHQPLRWQGVDRWLSTPDAPELMCMDWDDLTALSEHGWEIGSHTHSHPRLTGLSDGDLDDELRRSREECQEHLRHSCESIAYPYGDVDERVTARAQVVGYRAGAALSSSLRPMGALRWPRLGIYHDDVDRRFRLKMSPVTRFLRASQLWPDRE